MEAVGEHNQDEGRIDGNHTAAKHARGGRGVERGGANDAEESQRGHAEHGDVVAIPHEARGLGAVRIVFHQHEQDPGRKEPGGYAQVACDGGV